MKKILIWVMGCLWLMAMVSEVSVSAATSIRILVTEGPAEYDPVFTTWAVQAADTLRVTGTFPSGERTVPTDSREMGILIGADNLMTSRSLFLHHGNFSPASPWDQSHGATLWWWIIAESDQGDGVALSDIVVTLTSDDKDNTLGKTENFVGNDSYTTKAPGIRADGSVINSGSPTQKVRRVIVGVGSKHFVVKTVEEANEVRRWFAGFSKLVLRCIVTVGQTSETRILQTRFPNLQIRKQGNAYQVSVATTEEPGLYVVDFGPTPVGPFVPIGMVQAGQRSIIQNVPTEGNGFFRFDPYQR